MITLREIDEIEARANALRAAISHLRDVLCDAMTCSCSDAYTSRGMVDPGCRYHEFEDAVKFLAQVEGVQPSSRRIGNSRVCDICGTLDQNRHDPACQRKGKTT